MKNKSYENKKGMKIRQEVENKSDRNNENKEN